MDWTDLTTSAHHSSSGIAYSRVAQLRSTRAHLPRVKRADVMSYLAQRSRLSATPTPWDIKQGSVRG